MNKIKFSHNARYFARGERYHASGLEFSRSSSALQIKPIRAKDDIVSTLTVEIPFKDLEKFCQACLKNAPLSNPKNDLGCFIKVRFDKMGFIKKMKLYFKGYSIQGKTAIKLVPSGSLDSFAEIRMAAALEGDVIDVKQVTFLKIPGFPNGEE